MTIRQLKNIINDRFQVDISKKTRERHVIYPKKIYCYLACMIDKDPLSRIGKEINIDHATVIHNRNTVHAVYDKYKIECNAIIKTYDLKVPFLEVKEFIKPEKTTELDYAFNLLLSLNEKQIKDLRENRIEPYIKMLGN